MYKHILLPFNGSEPSRKAERECLELARSIGATVTAMTVLAHRRLPVEEEIALDLVRDLAEEFDIDAKRGARRMPGLLISNGDADRALCHSTIPTLVVR